MEIVVTGAGGFLGQRLVKKLLEQSSLAGPEGRVQPIERVVAWT